MLQYSCKHCKYHQTISDKNTVHMMRIKNLSSTNAYDKVEQIAAHNMKANLRCYMTQHVEVTQ